MTGHFTYGYGQRKNFYFLSDVGLVGDRLLGEDSGIIQCPFLEVNLAKTRNKGFSTLKTMSKSVATVAGMLYYSLILLSQHTLFHMFSHF
jgi:hypothetical protein